MKVRDPKPEVLRLEELVTAIRHGEIRLPKFQRPFVWLRSDVLNLFDSIYNGYPIGSILLWNSTERLKSEREIEGFRLTENQVENYPTEYLLDGQQRLTSLCATLYWDGSDPSSIWNIQFDLDSEDFVYTREKGRVTLFPLNKLLATGDFIKQCMAFESTNNSQFYYQRAERLLKAFKDYKIAVVKIGDVSLDEVAPIFERINSTGRKLTVVDLMRAATWKNGFDLTESIERIANRCRLQFGEISDAQILRMIATSANLGINKSDIDKLRHKTIAELNTAVGDTEAALELTIAFLANKLGLRHASFLPYGMQLNLLVEYFRLAGQNGQFDKVKNWFWKTSVSNYFGGASTGQLAKDLKAMREFASGRAEDISFPDASLDPSELFQGSFNLRTAGSKVMALLLRRQFEMVLGARVHSGNVELSRDYYFETADPSSEFHGTNASQLFVPTYLAAQEFEIVEQELASFNFLQGTNATYPFQISEDSTYAQRIESLTDHLSELTGIELERPNI